MGLLPIIEILPETWQNIPWTLQNSIQIIRDHCIKRRHETEDHRIFSIEVASAIRDAFCEYVAQANSSMSKIEIKADVQIQKDQTEFKVVRDEMKFADDATEDRIKKLAELHEGRIYTLSEKLDKMDNRDVVHKYVRDEVDAMRLVLVDAIKKQRAYVDKRFDDIYYDHLWKADFIGKGEECQYKSIMEYVTMEIPKIQKNLKTSATQVDSSIALSKNLKKDLEKYIKVDGPATLKKIDDRLKRAEHDIKDDRKKNGK